MAYVSDSRYLRATYVIDCLKDYAMCVTEDEDWTKRYQPSVQEEMRAREVAREQSVRDEESYKRGQIALRARNEIILADFQQTLATRISQAYQKLAAAGCPGDMEMGPHKKFRARSQGWQIRRSNEVLSGIRTDGTSPQWGLGAKTASTVCAQAQKWRPMPYGLVIRSTVGRVGMRYHDVRNRLDESTAELRTWAEAIIDRWSAALMELLAKVRSAGWLALEFRGDEGPPIVSCARPRGGTRSGPLLISYG
jgi:hypothetical protein